MVRFVLSFCLFVFLWWARLNEVVILSADDWVCIFLCLLFRGGILHRVLLVVGWCWALYLSDFLCVSSHYLILPRISSLVLGSWSQWSHSKGSGLDLKFCVGLYILFHWPGTPVHSQLMFCLYFCVWGVFLMYPWRETYSTSTYSSTILSSERKLLCYHLLVETSTLLKISQIEFATRSVCHHIPCSLTHIFFLVLPNYK